MADSTGSDAKAGKAGKAEKAPKAGKVGKAEKAPPVEKAPKAEKVGRSEPVSKADADPVDDQKAKFLEALERKQKGHQHPSGGSVGKGPSGAYGEHATEANKREFRRKSGG
jgi:hypothetical protein